MYSNFITPPDFVNDKFHTVTVVNASDDDVELLGRMCKGSDDQFNIYLYRSEMQDHVWLSKVIEISDAVIVNIGVNDKILEEILMLDKTYYYGGNTLLVKANRVDNVFRYFAIRYNEQNK